MPRIMSHQFAIYAALIGTLCSMSTVHAGDIQVSLIGKASNALVHAELIQLPSEQWPSEALQRTSSHTELLFSDVPPGQYAVRVFVDENGNGQLDRSARGIPQEPVGFSGNPVLSRGEPTPAATAITHAEGNSLVLIRLRQGRQAQNR